MPKLTIDGREVEVQHGATVMDAANKLGVYVPHFCYHRKLSIAANCRMCLVEIEKAPKPMPACATPVTEGMKVMTHSDNAKKAPVTRSFSYEPTLGSTSSPPVRSQTPLYLVPKSLR